MKRYDDEVRARWGYTEAFSEFQKKSKDPDAAADGLMKIFERIGKLKDLPPDDGAVQAEIARLQKYVTDNYYTCTDEILSGLGMMYSADERFRKNIDKAGGDGTARFASDAIKVYCGNK
ncbi:MAG: TipAS antibiotic-recognition domain-containing protein [Clostridia bacterium]|nr:TipAS antibiotic-recognition domain-containing protein [Clostridia bacterium]